MHTEQLEMLNEIMKIGFSTLEIALYLNTHPDDEKAVRLHNTFAVQYQELKDAYNLKYGPLTSRDLSRSPWEYINDPWPWDIEYCNICE